MYMNQSFHLSDQLLSTYLRDYTGGWGAAVAGVVPIPSVVRMKVSYSVWSGAKGGDTGHMARGGLVSGAAVTDPIPSTGKGWFPMPLEWAKGGFLYRL